MNDVKIHRMAIACADIYFGTKNPDLTIYNIYVQAFIKAYKDKIQ